MGRVTLFVSLATAAVVVGCNDRTQPQAPLTPSALTSPVNADLDPQAAHAQSSGHQASAAMPPDISGVWSFESVVRVNQPSDLNELIGAPPVGTPMTQVTCRPMATWTIVQHGATFDAEATQEVTCRVGEVEFVPPEFAFPPTYSLSGWINGRSVHLSWPIDEPNCQNHGSVRVTGGVAREIVGVTGGCTLPFHPGSLSEHWTLRRP
jgi:hypothetical protein